jgi:gluconate 2-dehydrogenase gamma chain
MLSRRDLAALLPALAANGKFEFFTAAQARDVEAIAAQIIPGGDSPGATEAGVVYFIDQALSRYFQDQQPLYRKGLAQLAGFAALPAEKQLEKLRSIEKTGFFEAIRTHTIMGFLADPKYGGNRDRAGWKFIGFAAAHVYWPPFGAYDADI